jgi:HK97 family phage prohead protease
METKTFIKSEIENIDEENLRIRHYISTPTKDRYGDVVNPFGFNETDFRKQPVVFFGHRSRELPIGKNLELKATDKGVMALTQFDRKSELANEVFRLNKEGFLSAWSIGYIPKKEYLKEIKDDNGNVTESYNYIENWDLLEYSSVPIPANPDAVNLMLKDIHSKELIEVFKSFELENKIKELENKIDNIKDFTKDIEEINEKINKLLKPENVGINPKLFDGLEKRIVEAIKKGRAGAFRQVTGRDL